MDAMINRILGEQRKNPRLMNPLVLAYIGDTVYDLYVRSWLIEGSDATAHGLHVMAAKRAASGLEALLGYLFLSGEDGRIRELMDNIKQSLFTEDKEK